MQYVSMEPISQSPPITCPFLSINYWAIFISFFKLLSILIHLKLIEMLVFYLPSTLIPKGPKFLQEQLEIYIGSNKVNFHCNFLNHFYRGRGLFQLCGDINFFLTRSYKKMLCLP
jgi:hypothetical protein